MLEEITPSTETTETVIPTEPTEVTPLVETTPETELIIEVTPTVVETKTEETTQPAPVKLPPPYTSFFEQYVEFIKENKFGEDKKAEQAIKALNNAIKAMLKAKTATAFNTLLALSKKYKDTLTIEKALQGIATLTKGDRAVVEIITTVFYMINNPGSNTPKSINLETVRSIIKDEAFVNWCAKKLG